MKIAILKPDHLGDLVLSVPAINKLQSAGHEITLLINKNVEFLAQFLFPNITLKITQFAHLSRKNESDDFGAVFEEVRNSDFFISLRNDPVLEELIFNKISIKNFSVVESSLDIHEPALQQKIIQKIVGEYSPLDFFYKYGHHPKPWPKEYKRIGFIISAGFFNNSLSLETWYEFGRHLQKTYQSEISVIFGPSEKSDAKVLKLLLGGEITLIEGSADVDSFLKQIKNLDLLLATDSGSAHIASLAGIPIVSLFGPSPYLRFQPLGMSNKVITLNFNCSPCTQFEMQRVNICISKECLSSIRVKDIERVLTDC